jgi:hypothetical protein
MVMSDTVVDEVIATRSPKKLGWQIRSSVQERLVDEPWSINFFFFFDGSNAFWVGSRHCKGARRVRDDHEDSTIGNELDFPEFDRSSVDDIQITKVGILSNVQFI